MKILWIMTARFDQGGTQNDMIQLARAMDGLGYEFHLAAPRGALVPELESRGVVYHELPDPLLGGLGTARYVAAVARVVRRVGPDLLAPQSVRASLAAGIVRRLGLTRAAVVASLHNLHDPSQAGAAARILYRSCQALTLENHYERRLVSLQETGSGVPTRVVYSGVDLDVFRPVAAPAPVPGLPICSGRLVGCVARLSEEKDHATLLRAWSRHVQDNPADRLVLVGDGPERGFIERIIAMLGIGDSVRLLGDRGDVPAILQHLDLFVLSSRRESYPRSAREALASGVPVILPAIGGCGEIVSHADAGLLFRSGDCADLTRCMAAILGPDTDSGLARRRARAHAEANFPLRNWREAMDGLYREFGAATSRQAAA